MLRQHFPAAIVKSRKKEPMNIQFEYGDGIRTPLEKAKRGKFTIEIWPDRHRPIYDGSIRYNGIPFFRRESPHRGEDHLSDLRTKLIAEFESMKNDLNGNHPNG